MINISIKDSLKKGWSYTKTNLLFLASATFIYLVLSIILDKASKGPNSFFIFIASTILSILFSIGMYRIGLKIEENKEPEFEYFKATPQVFLAVLWSGIISGLFVFLGLLLLIIPGVIIAIRLSMTSYVLLDKNLGGWQAVKESWKITKGYSMKIFLVMLSFIGIFIVSIIPLGLGLFVSIPFVYITGAIVYKAITQSKLDHSHDSSKHIASN
jgi:uncharacterized membrane protein